MSKRDILVLVEGEVTDVKLMENLLLIYGIHEGHQIVFYGTDIYSLYDSMFRNKDGLASLDIPLHLRSKENNPNKKDILSKQFSRILLIFDFDPQSTHYSPDSIKKMADYFVDSADMGMLYLNYPMIESFYHVKCIPDNNYMDYTASLAELKGKRETYKGRVSRESCISNRNTFFDNKAMCNIIIRQNLEKAWTITGSIPVGIYVRQTRQILSKRNWKSSSQIVVLMFYAHAFSISLTITHYSLPRQVNNTRG